MISIRSRAITILLALTALAPACLNDRDTLADEAKKNRDVLTTLVGGFERNPPLYYQMRIKRIEGDLRANPNRIDEYDDIAVANDRIGNDDEAIKWIEAKRKLLPSLDMKSETSKDEWYRYYANCGTFWVHRWAANGAADEQISDVIHGRDLISKALQINPNAHFGREKYQLMVMKWLIDSRSSSNDREHGRDESLGRYIERAGDLNNEKKREEAVIGLSGLIRLGGAWQSPDVYAAIARLYSPPERAMSYVAALRTKEILENGGKSLDPEIQREPYTIQAQLHSSLDDNEAAEYHRLRGLADKWNDDRQAFMMARLKAGRHPDTDPHFWDGAPAMPEFKVHEAVSTWLFHHVFTMNVQFLLVLFLCFGLPILAFWGSARRQMRLKAAQSPR